jgi:hypothetical protein
MVAKKIIFHSKMLKNTPRSANTQDGLEAELPCQVAAEQGLEALHLRLAAQKVKAGKVVDHAGRVLRHFG